MTSRSKILASAAASLFVAGGAGVAVADMHGGSGDEATVACQGVNACKGQSSCKTAHSECAGHNSCKGKGFLELTKEECEKAKAEMQEG